LIGESREAEGVRGRTMKKRVSYIAIGALLSVFSVRVEAQQPAVKVPRIGFLIDSSASDPATALRLNAFRQGLRELGYVEGKNIIVEHRYAEGKSERLTELAEDLARLKVDIFVVPNDTTARAAKKVTPAIPIVMASSGNPIGTGVIASLARPGGNVTGLTSYSPELLGKRLELLKEVIPKVSRFAFLLALHFLMMRAVRSAPPELPLRKPKGPRRL
jgi:putative ABC transport system substrate-binding protein